MYVSVVFMDVLCNGMPCHESNVWSVCLKKKRKTIIYHKISIVPHGAAGKPAHREAERGPRRYCIVWYRMVQYHTVWNIYRGLGHYCTVIILFYGSAVWVPI